MPGDEHSDVTTRLIPVLFLIGIGLMNMLSRVIFSPLLLAIKADLHLTHAQASSFFMLIFSGFSLGMFFSGMVSSRLAHRHVIVLSAFLSSVSLFAVAHSTSLPSTRIVLLFLGMGAGLYLPSGIATVKSLVISKNLGKAMAAHELGPAIGLVIAPILVGMLSSHMSWRDILMIAGLTNLLMASLFYFWGGGGHFSGLKPDFKNLGRLLAHPNFWIMAVLFAITTGGELGVYALLPTYLVSEKGIAYGTANTVFGFSRFSVVFTTFISGFFVDRFGVKKSIFFILLGSGMLTASLGLTSGAGILGVIFLQPVIVTCFFPAGFTVLSGIGSQQFTNIIVSMIIPISSIFGAGVIPYVLGILGESGRFATGFIFLGIMLIVSTILLRFLKHSR